MLCFCTLSTAEVILKDKFRKKENIAIPCKCQLMDSRIVGIEPDEGNCNEEGKNYFVFKGSIDDFNEMHDKIIMIDSWERLNKIKNKYIQSPALKKINRSEFSKYNYAIILVVFAGLEHLKNECLYEKNKQLYFSYETWEWQSDTSPACIEENLYILKLRKKIR
jgi:hypothetical protein